MTKLLKPYNSLDPSGAHAEMLLTSGERILITYSHDGFKIYKLYFFGVFPRLVWWSKNAERIETAMPELRNIAIGTNPIEPLMNKIKEFDSVEQIQTKF